MATYKSAPGTNGSFAMDKFVPALWSSRILKNLHDKQLLAGLTTREYEGEIKGKGDTVKIHGVGAVSIRDYITNLSTGDAVTYDVGSDTELLVEVDTAKYFGFKVEDIEVAQANPKFMSELSAEAAIAMAKVTDGYLYNKMYTAAVNDTQDGMGQRGASSTTNGGITQVDMSSDKKTLYNALTVCASRLDDMLCPDDGRFVVLPSFAKAALLQDDRFVNYANAGQGAAVSNRAIGSIAGFDVITMPVSSFTRWDAYNANAVGDLGIVTGTTADDYSGIYGRKGAIAYVEQIAKVENLRLEGFFADAVRGLHLFGAAAIRPQFLGVVQLDDFRVTDA